MDRSKEFDYTSNSSRRCVPEVDLEYPKELRELYNDYLLAPDKIEIKREMLPECQLKIAVYTILLLVMLKNLKCLTILIKKSICFIMKTYNFF